MLLIPETNTHPRQVLEEAGEFHADRVRLDDECHLRHSQHRLGKANVEDTVLESGLFTSEILRSGDLVSLT